jgi:uncharacterized protein YukE
VSELSNASRNLSRTWTKTQSQWSDATSKWRDTKRSEFENRYWSTLEEEVSRYIEALHKLMDAIRECQKIT